MNFRKIFYCLIISFIVFPLYSQSELYKMANGYRQTFWDESLNDVLNEKQLQHKVVNTDDENYNLYYENDIMMGQSTEVHYNFLNNALTSICYELKYSEQVEKKLLSKFKEIDSAYEIPSIKETDDFFKLNGKVLDNFNNANFAGVLDFLMADDIYKTENFPEVKSLFRNKIPSYAEALKKEGKNCSAKLYRIVINDLTCCYIISNFYEGKIFVVYTKKYEEKF